MSTVRNWITSICVVGVAASAIPSCGPSGPKLHPVNGQVLYEGKPVEGAIVVLHQANPQPGDRLPGATADKEGKFIIRTYPFGDGAPEGQYVALVSLLEEGRGADAQPKNKLPSRYSDITKTSLKVIVKPESNNLEPFQLTKGP